MKKLFTQLQILSLAVLPVLFFSCEQATKNSKSYSASLGSTDNVKALPQSDLKFLYEAYAFAHYNLQLANEAKYRSTATESQSLANAVSYEAEQLKDDLSRVASDYNLTLPGDMTSEQKDNWKELVKQKGWNFDKKFASNMDFNLKYGQALYLQANSSLQNETLKNIAQQALSWLETDGKLALTQQEKIKERTGEPKIKEDEMAVNNEKKKKYK